MKAAMMQGAAKNANVHKRKHASAEGGEKSDAAKEDRLRVSNFQDFWKNVHENVILLKATSPKVVETLNYEDYMTADTKKVIDKY